jgi:hypothetical protein
LLAAAARESSSKIQRRAAPIPRVSETVSDSVCRVPNETSFSTVCFIRAASNCPTTPATSAHCA